MTINISKLTQKERNETVQTALRILSMKCRAGHTLGSPDETRNYLCLRMGEYKNEVFGAIYLDNLCRVIAVREMFQGTVNSASVHPRVVVQQAMDTNAAAIIFFHNHPSGVAEPSSQDEMITNKLKEALAIVDVRVVDHFVVSAGDSVSFAERGLL